MLLKLIFGILGNITAIFLFTSPLPTFWKIYRRRATESFSVLPYGCALYNCLLWSLYSVPWVTKGTFLVLTINGFGAGLELTFILFYIIFAPRLMKIRVSLLLLSTLVVFFAFAALIVTVVPHSDRKVVVGVMCVTVAVALYASPLSIMSMVIRTRSLQYMPFFLSFFCFLNGTTWCIYGFVTSDIYIKVPNGLGGVLGLGQLILYAIYHNAKPTAIGDQEINYKLEENTEKKMASTTILSTGTVRLDAYV